jgi:hypothetical protein
MAIELIYCADGNERLARIAIDTGFTFGAQLPNTVYYPPEFVDQNWKKPDLGRYVEAVRQHNPRIATVLDWEREGQLDEVLAWAEAIAPHVETIIIIPKVSGGIARLPRVIGDRPIRLGYSVPTKFSGTSVPLTEFLGWPVHLLGGSPIKQMELAGLFAGPMFSETPRLDVVSADGNYHQKMATRYNQYFVPDGSARWARNRFWPTLREANGGENWGDGSAKADAPYEAFRRSCDAIMAMWQGANQPPRGASIPIMSSTQST